MKTLWLTIIALTVALAAPAAGAEDESGTLKTGVRSIVSDLVSAGKDLAAGFNEGINESRKGDGARGAANQAEFKGLGLSLKVIEVKFLEPGELELTLALKNPNTFPVRLTNLTALGNVAIVDRDGFSYALPQPAEQGRDITALGRSSTRVRFFFSEVEGRPETFRLFDIDVPIN